MSFFRNTPPTASTEATSTLINRPSADINGVREVIDELTGLSVIALPMTMAREIVPARAMMTAAYVLVGSGRIYCGESTRIGRRIYDHANDPTKAFARDAFIVTRHTQQPLDSEAVIYLQAHFTRRAEEVGLVTVQRGTGAQVVDVPAARGALYRQLAAIAERLLFDAGCRAFHPIAEPEPHPQPPESAEPASATETTPIEIGVAGTPGDATEYQLAYSDLWARGYDADGGFVVAAGSEVRRDVNPSVNPILHVRRRDLEVAGVLADIGGRADRQRLLAAVWFDSRAIAAKVVTGAHVDSSKWTPVCAARPFVLNP